MAGSTFGLSTSLARLLPGIAVLTLAVGAPHRQQDPDHFLEADRDAVIGYSRSDDLADAVSALQKKLDSGKASLAFDATRGYLPALLDALGVSIDSQTLVYSKTSSQAPFITPKTPRAIYFNERVYVGWVPDSEKIDLIAIDPAKGPIFFTLAQDASKPAKMVRNDRCMNCHIGPRTLNVPGLVLQSVHVASTGKTHSQIETFVPGHNNPLKQRWGGWYVSGTHGKDQHLGNLLVESRSEVPVKDLGPTSNLFDIRDHFDSARYLSPHSDTVALMVLDHSVRMHNHIIQAGWETKFALDDRAKLTDPAKDWSKKRIAQYAEALLVYMLFRDEAPIHGPLIGPTSFARDFPKSGPRDRKGRSLREFDLKTRLFKYPCSYLIYSPGFDSLPGETKEYLWRRMDEVLSGKDKTLLFKDMAEADRKAVLEILLDTKPEFKAWMHKERKA